MLAAFLVLGGGLTAVSRLGSEPRLELVVRVPRGADAALIERLVDESLLVELGLDLGWREDPLVADSLVRGLGFIGVAGDRAALLERASSLDLPRRDPLARARLMDRARSLLARVRAPSEAELEGLRAASPERFRRPTLLRFEHELLGDDDAAVPDLVLGRLATRSQAQLATILGPAAAAEVMALPVVAPGGGPGAWSSPIRSRLGRHRFKVLTKVPGEVPPLAEIRAEVAGAWVDSQREPALREGLARLRAERRIELEEVAP